MKYTIDRREGLTRDETPERLQEWLRANGHADAEVISTGFNPENGNLRVIVETADDPTQAIESYVPTPTADELWMQQILSEGDQAAIDIARKPVASRNPSERVTLAHAVRLGRIKRGDVG